MKKRNQKIALTATISIVAIIIMLLVLAFFTKRHAKAQVQSQKLNTQVYSSIGGNVASSLQHQLEISRQQIANDKKSINNLETSMKELMSKFSASDNDSQKSDISKELLRKEEEFEKTIKNQAQHQEDLLQKQLNKSQQPKIGDGSNQPNSVAKIQWITDESLVTVNDTDSSSYVDALNSKLKFDKGITQDNKGKLKPAFSIPDSTIFTGVTSFNDLVGRIPKGDEHTVFAPYQTVFHVDKYNFTSKKYKLPKAIDDVMGRAICFGDFMSSSVSCKVESLVYIFNDGTISTIYPDSAKKGKDSYSMSFNGLGYFTNEYGSPQIDGKLVTSLGLRVGGVALAGAVSGIGAAVSQSGLSIATTNGFSPINAVTNVGKFGVGQAVTNAANEGNKEFQDVTKNLFDYVDAPHWNKKTKSLMKYNIVTTQEIDVDYDPNGRKLNHHLFINSQPSAINIF